MLVAVLVVIGVDLVALGAFALSPKWRRGCRELLGTTAATSEGL